jgi:type IV secretory pathway TraG/TraD family ATPase VirD4
MTRRAWQHVGVAAVAAPVAAICIWSVWVVRAFELTEPYGHNLLKAAGLAFTAPNLVNITYGSVAFGFALAGGFAALVYQVGNPRQQRHNFVRGSEFIESGELARYTRKGTGFGKGLGTQVSIADVPIPRQIERLHFLIGGTTQSGKTVTITEMLADALRRGDRAVVADPNGGYYARFGQPGDVILNPFDRRSVGWSIFNEIAKDYDVERYARSVIPDARSAQDFEWHGYARLLFSETAQRLVDLRQNTTKQLIYWLTVAKIEELGELLQETPAVGLFDQGANKALSSTRFILTNYINPHKYLHPGDFSLRHWLEQGKGSLYITWREDMAEALRPLISTWFDVLVGSILSLPPSDARLVWFFLDELASMERLSSLEDGLTKGAKHGGRFVCGLQSTAQLDDIYTRDKAVVLRSCFRNLLVLNIPNTDPVTAEEYSKGLGEREFIRTEKSRAYNWQRGNTVTHTKRHVRERAVMPSEIHKLPDLTGYLKLAGDYPIAKVKLTPKDYPIRNKAIVEGDNAIDRKR